VITVPLLSPSGSLLALAQVVSAYLDEGAVDPLCTARRLLKLRQTYGDEALGRPVSGPCASATRIILPSNAF